MIDLEKHDNSQEKKAEQSPPATTVSNDKASVGWVFVVLFLMGPFGIIPAIVFFRDKRPKRALCCLIPALFYVILAVGLNIAALIYAKNNPRPAESSVVEDSASSITSTVPKEDYVPEVTEEPEDLAEIISDILGSDIPIISDTNEYQIYQATLKYFDNIRNHKINVADISGFMEEDSLMSEDAKNLLITQYTYASMLQEIYALANEDSDQRFLYGEALSHLDTVHAVLKTIEIDPFDPVVCPPLLDNVAYVTLDIYYMDYLPVFGAIADKLSSAVEDDEEMNRLVSVAYEYYKDEIPEEELNEDIIKSALYAYLFREYIHYAEPKVEYDIMATLWHRESGWEMELVGLPMDTWMNVYTAGLFIRPEQ